MLHICIWNIKNIGKNREGILRMLRRSDPLEEKHAGWKGLTWQSRWWWRISIHIEIWEHHLGKVWNQHLTLKQLEYHKPKQNKRFAYRISRNEHMIEISSEVFVVGPTRARSYSTIMYKVVHMTYEASLSQHSRGLFKTQRDHWKNQPWIGGPLDVEPQFHIIHLSERYPRTYLNSHL